MSKHASFGSAEFLDEPRKEMSRGGVFCCNDSRLRLKAREGIRP